MSHIRTYTLPFVVLLSACAGGPLVGPALEMQATRAALQASLNAEGEVEPARGDALTLQVTDPDPSQYSSLPLTTDAADTSDPAPEPEPTSTDTATQAAADALSQPAATSTPDLVHSLEQLTREMSEQRMLMMMQMVAGRGDAPVAVDSSGRLVDLSVSVQRLQDAQATQTDETATILAELQALTLLIDERVPVDTAQRLESLQLSADAVEPALDEVRAAQEALARRIQALEALHVDTATPTEDDGSGDADDTRGDTIPLTDLPTAPDEPDDEPVPDEAEDEPVPDEAEDEPVPDEAEDEPVPDEAEDEPVPDEAEATPTDIVEEPPSEPGADTSTPVDDASDPEEDAPRQADSSDISRAEADRIRAETRTARRAAEQTLALERRAARQEQRQSRRQAGDDRSAAADAREAELASRYSDEPDSDNSVAIAPVLIAEPRRRGTGQDDCIDTSPGPDGVRFGLDIRATRRLGRLLDRDVELTAPPDVVPLPPIVTCDADDDDA